MSSNAQKTHFAQGMDSFAQRKVLDALQLTGKALPCSVTAVDGSIVTVKFEVDAAPFTLPKVTIPMFGPEWIRYPTQVGDLGVVFAADVRIGNVSGLGGAAPKLDQPANLTALIFFPIANKNWTETDDPDAVVIYGPNGVIIRDRDKNCTITVDQENITIDAKTKVTVKVGDTSSIEITEDDIIVKKGDDSKITMTDDDVKMAFGSDNYILIDTDGVHFKGDLNIDGKITSTGDASLGGGAQFVRLADGSAATKVKAT